MPDAILSLYAFASELSLSDLPWIRELGLEM